MADPVDETRADLRVWCKLASQIKTAPRVGCANNRQVPQGLADALGSAN